MWRPMVGCLFLAIFFSGCATMDTSTFSRQFTVEPQAYSGLWHEIARTPNSFQDNSIKHNRKKFGVCHNSTAKYSIVDQAKVKVVNACTRISSDEAQFHESIEGEANIVPNTENRFLRVSFGKSVGRFFMKLFTGGGAPYWIYGIGPKNDKNEYEWSLVSTPKKNMLWLLSRKSQLNKKYLNEIWELGKKEGLPMEQLVFNKPLSSQG